LKDGASKFLNWIELLHPVETVFEFEEGIVFFDHFVGLGLNPECVVSDSVVFGPFQDIGGDDLGLFISDVVQWFRIFTVGFEFGSQVFEGAEGESSEVFVFHVGYFLQFLSD
jgi:hypothetical protein